MNGIYGGSKKLTNGKNEPQGSRCINGGVCWEGDIVRLCLSIYILFFFFFHKGPVKTIESGSITH